MGKVKHEKIHRINYLAAETEAIYHQASLKIGIPDSVMLVLYTLYDNGESCMLSDIYKQSGISKQTVNSAVRRLESSGDIYLEQDTGRNKKVFLTPKGKNYAGQTAARLYEAESRAFASWTEEEIETYITLMGKYAVCLREQIQTM